MDILRHFREQSKIFLAQTALHLEGIHLDEVDTKELLTKSNKKFFDVDEEDAIIMRNIVNALDYLETLDFAKIDIDLNLYIHINSILADEQALFVGKLRDCPTAIGCIETEISVYDHDKIIQEINRLKTLTFNNYKKIVPDVFCKLARMQPFFDGNKRSTNFLCNIALIKNNLGIFYIDYEHLSTFNSYLKEYYQEKSNKILEFIGNKLIRTWEQLEDDKNLIVVD